jgi:DNA-binding NarL/FixJ family response regulator
MTQRQRVLIVDGSRYFGSLIWRLLIPESRFEIVGLARSVDEALGLALACSPDVMLVDVSHAAPFGLAAIASLHTMRPITPILAFTSTSGDEYSQAALTMGAAACLAKSEVVDGLTQTILSLIRAPSDTARHLLSEGAEP